MAIRVLAAATLCLGSCAFEPASVEPVGTDAIAFVVVEAEPQASFGAPTALASLNSAGAEDDPTLTADQLEIWFERDADIYTASRRSIDEAFGPPSLVVEVSTGFAETTPEVSGDGSTLFFSSDRAGNGLDIYLSIRRAGAAAWSPPARVDALSSSGIDTSPVSVDGTWMILASDRLGTMDLLESRLSTGGWWSTPSLLAGMSETMGGEMDGTCDATHTVLYFVTDWRGSGDLFVSSRASADLPWEPAVPLEELDSNGAEDDPWISPDLQTLYFSSDRDGSMDLFVSRR